MINQCDWKTKISTFFMAVGICLADLIGKALGIFLVSVALYEMFSSRWNTYSDVSQFYKVLILVFFIWNHSMFDWKLGDKWFKRWELKKLKDD